LIANHFGEDARVLIMLGSPVKLNSILSQHAQVSGEMSGQPVSIHTTSSLQGLLKCRLSSVRLFLANEQDAQIAAGTASRAGSP
jgi:hypothetical protein